MIINLNTVKPVLRDHSPERPLWDLKLLFQVPIHNVMEPVPRDQLWFKTIFYWSLGVVLWRRFDCMFCVCWMYNAWLTWQESCILGDHPRVGVESRVVGQALLGQRSRHSGQNIRHTLHTGITVKHCSSCTCTVIHTSVRYK